jgi:hypothetical protein
LSCPVLSVCFYAQDKIKLNELKNINEWRNQLMCLMFFFDVCNLSVNFCFWTQAVYLCWVNHRVTDFQWVPLFCTYVENYVQ